MKTNSQIYSILENFSFALDVPILVFNDGEKLINYFPEHFIRPPEILRGPLYRQLALTRNLPPQQLYTYSDIYHHNFFIYPIKDNEGAATYISIGPLLMNEIKQDDVRKLLISNEFTLDYEENLLNYFHQLRVVTPNQFQAIKQISELTLSAVDPNIRQTPQDEESRAYDEFKQRYEQIKFFHQPKEFEEHFLSLFKQGDEACFDMLKNIDNYPVPSIGNGNPVRSRKNLMISMITLLVRTSVEAGVEQEEAYSLGDFYINLLESIDTLDRLLILEKNIYHSYFNRVKKQDRSTVYTPLVARTIQYVSKHLSESISLDDIAGEFKVHPNYLSSLFKKETGDTLSQYINRQRIKEAKELLINTDYSLLEISTLMGFNTQSYFARIFKRHEGVPPNEYRRHYHNPTV
ncbi:helix-turn-helix domain-containing protein [Thalassobacillus sp. CUG 92003]|uniref:helix-turn-helix domain-containing protein n=1 Tax=Thalassobacillus sp. CUG 92003 TaxID=2736641 RepID=UPI0015E7BF16|nr:helix-turn-helix domain-containing protein [Thalassobacillus sp. CUG 92003]